MAQPIRGSFERIKTDESGAAGIEFTLIAPLFIILMFSAFTIFDLFRADSIANKATFTIGDFMSRQTEATDPVFKQVKDMMQRLARNDVGQPLIRISSITRMSEEPNGFSVDWTYNSGSGELSAKDIDLTKLPDIAVNDSIILTETYVNVYPFMAIVIGEKNGLFTFEHNAVTRPRFVGRIVKPG